MFDLYYSKYKRNGGITVKLSELLKGVEHEVLHYECDTEVTSVTYDSRKVITGGVFVCIPGFKADGHEFIEEAILNGGKTLIVEKAVGFYKDVTIIKVEDARETMSKMASTFYGNPSHKMDLIGVTGTNGKTTITYLLKEILEEAYQSVGLIGTISNWIGNKEIPAERTTPESPDFQCLLKNMVEDDLDTCVMEVSSHSLSLHRVSESTFQVGIFTNLTEDHLDFHPTIEHYYESKKKLFTMTQKANVINADDPYGVRLIQELKKLEVPVITYGMNLMCTLRATDISMDFKGVRFTAVGMGMNHRIRFPIPGKFSVYNALATIAAARSMGIEQEILVRALEKTNGIPGRFQRINEITAFGVIVDYAHTTDALENVLEAIRQFAEKKVISVFGCGGDRDSGKRSKMGAVSGKLSDYTILTSDNPRSENPYHILRMIEEGIKVTQGDYEIIENRREAIRKAISLAEKGDVVLIAGKGHETTQTIENNTEYFNDYEVAIEVAREENAI